MVKADITIAIDYHVEHGTYKLCTSVPTAAVHHIIGEYLRILVGSGRGEPIDLAEIKPSYNLVVCYGVDGDTFGVLSDCGSKDLETGILLDVYKDLTDKINDKKS